VWKSSIFGGVKGSPELTEIANHYMSGEFSLDDFMSYSMGLNDINKAFDLMQEG
jgi:S-(hydroxymethyl)glutathione dehydrogenase/alcohol dehydrogenase